MSEPHPNNELVSLLYGELDETEARKLRVHLDSCAECMRTFEEFSVTRRAYQELASEDLPHPTTTANILREARLTADKIVRAKEETARFPFLPTFAFGALIVLLGVGTWVIFSNPIQAPSPADDTNRGSVVARGSEAPIEDEMARRLDDPRRADDNLGAIEAEETAEGGEETQQKSAEPANSEPVAVELPTAVAADEPADLSAGDSMKDSKAGAKVDAFRNKKGAPQKQSSGGKADLAKAPVADIAPTLAENTTSKTTAAKPAEKVVATEPRANVDQQVQKAQEPPVPRDLDSIAMNRAGAASVGTGGALDTYSAPSTQSPSSMGASNDQVLDGGSFSVTPQSANFDRVSQVYGSDIDTSVLVNTVGTYEQGLVQYQSGRYTDAIAAFTSAISAGDQAVDATYYRGLTFQKLGRHLDAIKDLRTIVENHLSYGNYRNAQLALGDSLLAVNSIDDAQSMYQAVADAGGSTADIARTRLAELETVQGGGTGADTASARKEKKKASRSKMPAKDNKMKSESFDDMEQAVEPAATTY
ncbi:MAG: hypothetical protein COW42_14995 [Deltaproteobacteria bacterium CG17_big_fil_post_rev_8_21_14_2_50_63_7]|nr:MAG: hypothetical protein COW42_14995 [Deltaproteobacteria bacterium CG17_big_fil_post_rev_8_21_14_2_50_63_7]